MGVQKSKFWANFGQLRNFIANISGIEQNVVEWKTALQTAISPTDAHLGLTS